MKKMVPLIAFIILIYPAFLRAEDTLSEAQKLADDSNQILSELEEATQKGDSAKATALGTVYSQSRAKLDQDTQELKAQGREDEASSVEETVRQGTLKHLDVLQRVRDQVPEQARFGIDRAIQASSRRMGAAANPVQGNTPPASLPAGTGRGLNPMQEEEGSTGGGPPSFAGGFKGKGRGGHGGRPF